MKLQSERIAQWVQRQLASAPPLNAEQAQTIRRALAPRPTQSADGDQPSDAA